MVGEVYEWNVDWWNASYVDPCLDCMNNLSLMPDRVIRGGQFNTLAESLQPTFRVHADPTSRDNPTALGLRCARAP